MALPRRPVRASGGEALRRSEMVLQCGKRLLREGAARGVRTALRVGRVKADGLLMRRDLHLRVERVEGRAALRRQLAEHVQAQFPAIKILSMSGYTDNVLAQHPRLVSVHGVLEKPFAPDALVRMVWDVLHVDEEGLRIRE